MKRYSQRSGHMAMAELNVTPLLDLAFVLLIIFIITTPLMENNVKLQLPAGSQSDSGGPVDPKSIRTVSIDATGQVFLDQQPVELPVLRQELANLVQQDADTAVVVRADKSLRYQSVMDAIDAIRGAGVQKMELKSVTQ
jgi:biopolymer transport protein ExbD